MRSLGRFVRGLVTAVVVAAAIAVPGALFVGLPDVLGPSPAAVPPVVPLSSPPRPAPAADQPVSIPVLTYHDVSDRGGRHTVTPERFAEHLAALDAAGYESVTLEDVARLLGGDASGIPARPVLLTFDDGAASLDTHVDPLLEAYDASAVAFLITDVVADDRDSYYLGWDRVRALTRTGRWSFGSHTADLHHDAPLPAGSSGPPLVNRLALPGGSETFPAWQRRVEADLERSLRTLWLELRGPPVGFSYPFTAATAPSNDARIPPLVHTLVVERFGLGFGGDQGLARTVTSVSDPGHLPRVGVAGDVDGQGLLDTLDAVAPIVPTGELDTLEWTASEVSCVVRHGSVRLRGSGYGRCRIEGDTSLWRDYEVQLEVHGADRDQTAIVALRDGAAGWVEVQLGEATARVQQRTADGWEVLREFAIDPADPQELAIDLRDQVLRVRIGDATQRITVDEALVDGAFAFGLASRSDGGATFIVREVTATSAALTRADADRRATDPPSAPDVTAPRQNWTRS